MTINIASLVACFIVCALGFYLVRLLKEPIQVKIGLAVVAIVFVVWLLAALGIWGSFPGTVRVK